MAKTGFRPAPSSNARRYLKPPAVLSRRSLGGGGAGWIGCNIALHRIPPDARIAIVATMRSPSPPRSGGEGRGEVALRAQRDEVVISSPEEVREKFRKVKPLKDLSTKQRGWTLDVLNIVRRVMDTKRQRAGALQDASRSTMPLDQRASVLDCLSRHSLATADGSPLPLSNRKFEPHTFTNDDIYSFAPELEKLHPDNRHIRDKIRQQLQVLRDTGFLEHVSHGEWRLK